MADILDLLEQRNPLALELLQQQYGNYCQTIIGGILNHPQETEEALSDVWLQVWNAVPPLKPLCLQAYLAKTARNIALNYLKRNHAQKREALTVLFDELSDCIPDLRWEAQIQHQDLRDSLNAFLRSLPQQERRIFLCRYWYGDSINQLTQRFHCSQSKVTSMLFRTRKKLRKHLEKEGYRI